MLGYKMLQNRALPIFQSWKNE